MLETLRETWLSDEEYNVNKGIILEHQRTMAMLEDLEKRYYKASATSELGLHPIRVIMREIQKSFPIELSKD